MKNLSIKEKVLLVGLFLVLFVALAYIFVIMPLDKKTAAREVELKDREYKFQQYELIKSQNAELEKSIDETEKDIAEIETSLLADVDIDVIENYVMAIFESKGSKYLSDMKSEDIAVDDIYLPNGTVANEKLQMKRITVEYATTDGYTIPEYNKSPEWATKNGVDYDLVNQAIALMGSDDPNYAVVGYDEFIAALKVISEELPSCMKIHRVYIEDSTIGFVYLRAEVDIYSAKLGSSRVSSTEDANQVKMEWVGRTKVDCSGGMIGMPILNLNPNNSWYLVSISYDALKDFQNRPYCSYFSNAILTEMAKQEIPLYTDFENKVPGALIFAPDANAAIDPSVPVAETDDGEEA